MRFLRSSEWRSHSKVGEDAIGHLRVSKARCEVRFYGLLWWPTTEDRNFQSRSAANAVLLLF